MLKQLFVFTFATLAVAIGHAQSFEFPDDEMSFADPRETACADAPSTPLRAICRITNEERKKRGLIPLIWDARLARVAQLHANDMTKRNYFSHTTPEGRTWKDRLDRGGVPYSWSGENIAWGYETPEKFMQAWMRSRGHRENILHSKYSRIGIGWSGSKVVQDFTDGRKKP